MISREKLIDAAATVYAVSGYRGATTRRIADEAGVNEITIFRLFGTKAALIDEALRTRGIARPDRMPSLPTEPVDPERELAAWCGAHLEMLRADRALIRKTMSEHEERPDAAAPCVAECSRSAAHELRDYMKRLRLRGLTSYEPTDACDVKVDPYAAGAMLMAALLADAMGRDFMPEMYPQPAERAPVMYVRCFLRAIGCRRPAATRPRRGGATVRATKKTMSRTTSSTARKSR